MLRRMGISFCAVILACSVELGIEHAAAVIGSSNENITNLTCDQNLQSVLTSYYFLLIVPVPYLLLSLGEISSVIPGKIIQILLNYSKASKAITSYYVHTLS